MLIRFGTDISNVQSYMPRALKYKGVLKLNLDSSIDFLIMWLNKKKLNP